MFQEALFYARIKNVARQYPEAKETIDAIMQWANTDGRVLHLIKAMQVEMNRQFDAEFLAKTGKTFEQRRKEVEQEMQELHGNTEVPTDGGKPE